MTHAFLRTVAEIQPGKKKIVYVFCSALADVDNSKAKRMHLFGEITVTIVPTALCQRVQTGALTS